MNVRVDVLVTAMVTALVCGTPASVAAQEALPKYLPFSTGMVSLGHRFGPRPPGKYKTQYGTHVVSDIERAILAGTYLWVTPDRSGAVLISQRRRGKQMVADTLAHLALNGRYYRGEVHDYRDVLVPTHAIGRLLMPVCFRNKNMSQIDVRLYRKEHDLIVSEFPLESCRTQIVLLAVGADEAMDIRWTDSGGENQPTVVPGPDEPKIVGSNGFLAAREVVCVESVGPDCRYFIDLK